MTKSKLRMSNKRFIAIITPILAILLGLIIAATVAMNYFSGVMDLVFGKGARVVSTVAGTENWDADYYDVKYNSEEEARAGAMKVAEEVANEGDVLLKNNGVLPLAKNSKVSPMGYRFISPNYGASHGSASFNFDADYFTTPEQALAKNFELNTDVIDQMKASSPYFMTDTVLTQTVKGEGQRKSYEENGSISEYDPAIYDSVKSSLDGSTAIVFLGRQAGEVYDLYRYTFKDGTKTSLNFSQYELGTVNAAKQYSDKVIVVLNTVHTLNLAPLMSGEYEADAIVWIGGPGCAGYNSLSSILCGDVVPSGRTVDTYISDPLADPTTANYGDESKYTNVTTNTSTSNVSANFIEYEEGIYVGYKYYETAAVEDDTFVYGSVDANGATVEAGAVNYPFGYGLSYTTFTQEIAGTKLTGDDLSVTVKVTNTGDYAGKEVVQLYLRAPYGQFEKENKIERAYVSLIGYAKTKEIQPNEDDTVTINFTKDDLTAYCYTHNNSDGTKGCYVLPAGEYVISLQKNSHDVIDDSKIINVSSTVWYEGNNPRQTEKDMQSALDNDGNPLGVTPTGEDFVAATNKFQEMTDYATSRMTILSRSDWKNTQPTKPTDLVAPQYVVDAIDNTTNFDPATDALLGDVATSQVYNNTAVTENADNGLTISSLRGIDYYDEAWDELLNNLDYSSEEVLDLITKGYYQTLGLDDIGMPSTEVRDGPVGITVSSNDTSNIGMEEKHCLYPCGPIIAATFNVDLAYEYGEAAAQEAMWHNDGNTDINGWYAPCINIHRGPYGGRQYEYLTEDSLLSGLTAAGIVSGSAESGLFTTIKHFAANNQQSARDGLNTWMTEQAFRETYLKPFEVCIRTAMAKIKYISDTNGTVSTKTIRATTGLMTAKNAIGCEWASTNYALKVEVLKNEWGYRGLIITDNLANRTDNVYSKIIRSGGSLIMETANFTHPSGLDSNTGKNILREAVHEIAYTVVNSNAMQGVVPGAIVWFKMSPWQGWLIAANVVVYFVIAAGIVLTVLRVVDDKKHPEKYNHGQKI